VLAERSSSDAYSARFKDRVIRCKLGQWADAVVANSLAGYYIWAESLRRGARAHVVRNALPLEAIARSGPVAREQLGLEAHQPIVVFVGRLALEKNLSFLLDVAMEICARSSAAFLICGDGPLRRSVEEIVKHSRAREQIRVLGQQDDVWPIMKASQALVSTSTFEGQPNAVLEAMACGCPLVVSDIAAHREFLGVKTAEIVPMVKEHFVRAVIHALKATPDVLSRAEEARRQVGQHDARSAALAYEHIYGEAMLRHERCVE
jgi:glycosyltransferase involved in cell wall biosynthesis